MHIATVFGAALAALAALEAVLAWNMLVGGGSAIWTVATVVVMLIISGIVRLWVVLPDRIKSACPSTTTPLGPRSTLVVLGSGGHTTEMLRLLGALDRSAYTPRTYVYADTDKMSPSKLRGFEGRDASAEAGYTVRLIPRTREVRQSAVGTVVGTLRALAAAFPIVFSTMPDVVLTNGPGTCIPLCVAAYVPRFLGIKRIQVVYVESICRVESLSVTGKLLYLFCDGFVVQWKELAELYPAATYLGRIY